MVRHVLRFPSANQSDTSTRYATAETAAAIAAVERPVPEVLPRRALNTGDLRLWTRRTLTAAAIVGGGLLSGVLACSYYVVRDITGPSPLPEYPEYVFTPFEMGIPFVKVRIPSRAGVWLHGWWMFHQDNTDASAINDTRYLDSTRENITLSDAIPPHTLRPLVIICPQYRGRKSDMLGIASALWRVGFQVLTFDYRGHGEHIGTLVTLGYQEVDDLLDVVTFAHYHAPQAPFGVMGFSMGGAVAIMGAARDQRLTAVIADSAFATQRNAVRLGVARGLHIPPDPLLPITDLLLAWRAGYHFHDVEPLREATAIAPRPLLLIHGEADHVVSVADAYALHAAAGATADLWVLPQVDHCGAYFYNRVAYCQRVISFFTNTLGHPSPPPPVATGPCLSTS